MIMGNLSYRLFSHGMQTVDSPDVKGNNIHVERVLSIETKHIYSRTNRFAYCGWRHFNRGLTVILLRVQFGFCVANNSS
jgi:hypothetical protein